VTAVPPILAAAEMKRLMESHFRDADSAARDPARRVAWCTSVGPAELLRALGFALYFPENHGAMLGATRAATDLIGRAGALGYSPEVCSYMTSDIGAFLAGETPLTKAYPGLDGVPRPDVLVYNTNQCREVQDWFLWYGRRLGVPVLGIHSPRGAGEVTREIVDGVAAQFRSLVAPLEEIAGRRLDPARLEEALALSSEAASLWRKVLELGKRRPSPLTFFDGAIHMGPIVVLRGTRDAVDYYRLLLDELTARADARVGGIERESWRLYWEGMPVWGKLRFCADRLAALGACVVASTYCNSWVLDGLDPADPWGSQARVYSSIFIARSEEYKEATLAALAKDYAVDAVLFHDARTCPYNSNNRHGMPQRLRERHGLRSIAFGGDLNDLRCFSDAQFAVQVEALVEMLRAG
jgi:benzoyl-CoA reductase/2-hydroxyglutaryl-CoA dehydratase subunit BcrC/BadD/HgdB